MAKALIVIDYQYDFVTGSLAVKGAMNIHNIIEKLVYDEQYDMVIFTRDWHPDDHCSFVENGGQWPKHCVQGTDGAEIFMDHFTVEKCIMVSKAMDKDRDSYSGFEVVNDISFLNEVLNTYHIDEIDICGLALDYCVKATALDAVKLGFKTNVILNATKPVNPDYDIRELTDNGVNIIEG